MLLILSTKKKASREVVANTNPRTQEEEAVRSLELKASLLCGGSSRTARTVEKLGLKKQIQKERKGWVS